MPVCELCRLDKPLENSHFPFPAFIFRWMKKTGGSLFRRPGANPNIAYQDGEQAHLLCGDCEDLFQIDEDLFARRIFQPVVNGDRGPLPYDEFLSRFLISILWRNLTLTLSGPEPEMGDFAPQFLLAAEEWRTFLLKSSKLSKFDRIHLFITSTTSNTQYNQYLARAVDSTIVTSASGRCGVYAKFARFILFAEISDDFNASEWVNTRIEIGAGVLLGGGPQLIKDPHFGSFVRERAELAKRLMQKISPAQAAKIELRSRTAADRILGSELGAVLAADAFPPEHVPKVGRNEPCPCRSGLKYKKCHGA